GACEVVIEALGRGRLVAAVSHTLDHQGRGGEGCDLGETILQGVVTRVEELGPPPAAIPVKRDRSPIRVFKAPRRRGELRLVKPPGRAPSIPKDAREPLRVGSEGTWGTIHGQEPLIPEPSCLRE